MWKKKNQNKWSLMVCSSASWCQIVSWDWFDIGSWGGLLTDTNWLESFFSFFPLQMAHISFLSFSYKWRCLIWHESCCKPCICIVLVWTNSHSSTIIGPHHPRVASANKYNWGSQLAPTNCYNSAARNIASPKKNVPASGHHVHNQLT